MPELCTSQTPFPLHSSTCVSEQALHCMLLAQCCRILRRSPLIAHCLLLQVGLAEAAVAMAKLAARQRDSAAAATHIAAALGHYSELLLSPQQLWAVLWPSGEHLLQTVSQQHGTTATSCCASQQLRPNVALPGMQPPDGCTARGEVHV